MTTYEILKSIEKEIDDLEFIDNIDLCPRDFLIGRIDVKKILWKYMQDEERKAVIK